GRGRRRAREPRASSRRQRTTRLLRQAVGLLLSVVWRLGVYAALERAVRAAAAAARCLDRTGASERRRHPARYGPGRPLLASAPTRPYAPPRGRTPVRRPRHR